MYRVLCASDDHDTMVQSQTEVAEPCEIFVSNIPASLSVEKLRMIFESERVTGIADCGVLDVSCDSNDPTCAVIKFYDYKGRAALFW